MLIDGKRVIRVFPTRTSYTPTDEYAFVGMPPLPMFIPEHDEVHISCTFTWDRKTAEELAYQWEGVTNKPVKIGGVAYKSPALDFTPGLYVRNGITFTTRGCNNDCPWCGVRQTEGKLIELPTIHPGNIIQDNNFLQASRAHKDKVFDMLRTQRGICFRGGLQSNLIDDHFVNAITSLHIAELWLACDTDAALPAFKKAMDKLRAAGFNRIKVRCYSIIGKDMEKEEARNREIWHSGAMPYSQLYMDFSDTKKTYSKEWHEFQRTWCRYPVMKAHMNHIKEE